MYDFHSYLCSLPSSPLVEAVRALYEASEGDARKYMKKMLQSLGLEQELAQGYGDNWAETAFNKIRNAFVHQGCDVYFVPGIARIAYGDLHFDSEDEDTQKLALLKNLVKFITIAHKAQFTRNLEKIDVVQEGPQKGMKVKSKPLTLDQLSTMFSREQKEVTGKAREQFAKEHANSEGNGYKIIELKNFEQAHQFLPYCTADKWCYLQNESTFDSYAGGGNKLYLALAPGFEKLKPGDPGYGRSMIGFDMGPVDENGKSELCVCTNRYNHAENLENEEGAGSGDSAYDEIQLSKILGFPVWERCPGYTVDEMLANGLMNMETMKTIVTTDDELTKLARDKKYQMEFLKKYRVEAREEWRAPGFCVSFCKINKRGFHTTEWFAMLTDEPDHLIWFKGFSRLNADVYSLELGSHKFMVVFQTGKPLSTDVFYKVGGDHFPLAVCKMIDGEKRYNYLDLAGRYVSKDWFAHVGTFDAYTNYACVQRDDGKENVIDKSGKLMLSEWYDSIKREYDKGFYFVVDDKDVGKKLLYTWEMKPFCGYVDEMESLSGVGVLVKSNGKYNVAIPKDCGMLCDLWFDAIDDRLYIAPNGSYALLVFDKDQGYNFIDVETHKQLIEKWYPLIKYIEHGFFYVKDENGRINIYETCTNRFMLPQWFEDHGVPEIQGYEQFGNLMLNGKPVRVVNGKIMPPKRYE